MENPSPRDSARPFPAEGVELLPGRDYRIVERINRPAEGADRGEGAESVVFKIERGGKQFALKMINHSIGTVEDIVMSLASERHGRGEPWRQLRGDRAVAEERRARRNTDAALLEELGGEWQRISRLMLEYPHQNLAPVLHWYHSGEPSLRGRDSHGVFVPDEARREAAADRTLFMVMTLYPHGSLSSFMKRHGMGNAARAGADFYGLGWTRFNTFMRHMLQAVSHLIDNHMVHGRAICTLLPCPPACSPPCPPAACCCSPLPLLSPRSLAQVTSSSTNSSWTGVKDRTFSFSVISGVPGTLEHEPTDGFRIAEHWWISGRVWATTRRRRCEDVGMQTVPRL